MRSQASDPAGTIVISGIGLATALGRCRDETWAGIRAGRSGACRLDEYASELTGHAGFPLCETPQRLPLPGLLGWCRVLAHEALVDAGLQTSYPDLDVDLDRVGVLVGLSKGELSRLGKVEELTHTGIDGSGPGSRWEAISRYWPDSWPNAGAAAIAAHFELRGPCLAPIAACATGLVAALQGADLIRRGACDVALVGSVDLSLDPLVLGAFRRMKVLARVGDDPTQAVRPWSRDRSGFLVGEGGAILVLERLESVRARGGTAYAELVGGAIGSDAFHETNLSSDPTGFARLITRALRNSGVEPAEVAHVNVHGTATGSNDPLECRALRLAFGTAAERLACSASKAQVGHLLGAAGSVELALTALAVRDGFVPPTLNLDDPDPACDLDGTPHQGRSLDVPAALKLSLGFGGHLAAAVLRRVST